MKRHNAAAILLIIAGNLAAGVLLGILMGFLLRVQGFNWCLFITVPLMMMFFTDLPNLIVFPFAKKKMDKYLKEQNFGTTTTFICRGFMTFRSMLCIDEDTGRIAYISVTNPFKVQMAEARELSKFRSTYARGPFGGTRHAFFEFYQGKNRLRFTTFRSPRSMWTVSSTRVQNALATGDRIGNLLLKFNPNVKDLTKDPDMPFSKTGLWGFILAFISIYFAIAALISEFFINMARAGLNRTSEIPFYALSFAGIALAAAGLILGIKVLKDASKSPVRGSGFAKTAIVMGSIVLIILVWIVIAFIFG